MDRLKAGWAATWAVATVVLGFAAYSWVSPSFLDVPTPDLAIEHLTNVQIPEVAPTPERLLSRDENQGVSARSPFRMEGQMLPIPRAGEAGNGRQAETRHLPALTLTGTAGGPPWHAVIVGLPGHESGIVLTVGEEKNGFRVDSIRTDTVFITGLDTTLTIGVRGSRQ